MKRCVGFLMALFLIPLLATGDVCAQSPDGEGASSYLDFRQFSTIVPADKISFLDKLKLAAMRIVKAPALKEVVALYEYTTDNIDASQCSNAQFQDHYALLVAQGYEKESVDPVLANIGNSEESREVSLLEAELAALDPDEWITRPNLESAFGPVGQSPDNMLWSHVVPGPEPVWREVSFANSCDLQRVVRDLDRAVGGWRPVSDPKLRSIFESGANSDDNNNASAARVIVAHPFFAESSEPKNYLAECEPAYVRNSAGASLCGTVLQ